jgi:hypothetical protein
LAKELWPGRAGRARHRHFNGNIRLSLGLLVDLDVVDQAQIDDVYEQFGIDDPLEGLAHFIFSYWHRKSSSLQLYAQDKSTV